MNCRSIALLTSASLWLASCGDAPRKVDPPQPNSAGGQAHYEGDGHDHSADDGHDHGAAPSTAAAPAGGPSWSGVIVLKGERATSDKGVLMVSLVSRGQRMPRMTYRLPLTGQSPAVDGERRIPFRLDQSTDMLRSGLPSELQGTPLDLSVRFDQDGMVETREGDVTVAMPVGWGAEGLEIVVGG